MAEIQDDTKIYPILSELSACLCNEVGERSCFCGIIVGNDIPLEYAGLECESQVGYVRLISAYPSVDFPEQDATASCVSLMAYSIAVGIVRVWDNTDEDGGPRAAEDVIELSRLMLADMAVIRRTIQCCFGDKFEDIEYIVGAYTPLSGVQGVAGGEQLVTIQERF
ncbi:hypothetical protein SEA_ONEIAGILLIAN_31 [Microbacterium phage OneinaGillian]|uniref:Uncharacterized protein n=1 Tax=Microbacterium phage OneinaGillian TaxID=2301604 RepID=A0A385UEV4_9CAUD|nr:hypothetical protein HOU23_gp031 [Microbacterium phage OneinaGillian]AYB70141.1 hypothetical protein SEA_ONEIAGILLIAN_31 [Microbacterium phage OneinaGillian]